jgi:hypothetical protein
LGVDHALGGGIVKLSGERVAPGRERADENRGAAVTGNHFFPIQRVAVEFFRCGILILYQQFELRAGRNLEFGWLEFSANSLLHARQKEATARSKKVVSWRPPKSCMQMIIVLICICKYFLS